MADSGNSSRDDNHNGRNPNMVSGEVVGETNKYEIGRVVGTGSFGIVTEARSLVTGETVAIKRVLQDCRFKNRELDIMMKLAHPNVVRMVDHFFTNGPPHGNRDDKYLYVVMEFVPDTVYRVMKTFVRNKTSMPMILVKLYSYQILRSLGYLHAIGICHRDIKPQNLLVDTRSHSVKLCDFGSAKVLKKDEPSVAYICSRYYRAPELMLGCENYTTAIDVWSIGCVIGELILGKPFFPGSTNVDQLVKIIQTIGTPTIEEMHAMNPAASPFSFPPVLPVTLELLLPKDVDKNALDLLKNLLKYDPRQRLTCYKALEHPFFDELRLQETTLPGGRPLPALFDFSADEVRSMGSEIHRKIVPHWYVNEQTRLAHQYKQMQN